MSRRGTSFTTIDAALKNELEGKYALVRKVANSIDSIELLAAQDIEGLVTDLNEATDFTGITVVQGDVTGWDPVTKVLTVVAEKGDSLLLSNIINNDDYTYTWSFSDGSSYTTGELRGATGPQGVSVHHITATSTTALSGVFGSLGEVDTYTFYADAEETIELGSFSLANGDDPYLIAVGLGFVGTRQDFYDALSNLQNLEASAATSAETSLVSASLAQQAASNAESSEASALTSANFAQQSELNAATSEASALDSATIAGNYLEQINNYALTTTNISDLDLTNKTNGSVLVYNSTNEKFVADTVLENQLINGGSF